MHLLLRALPLLFILCMPGPAAFGDDAGDWKKQTNTGISAIEKAFSKFEPGAETDSRLSDWLEQLTELSTPVQKCIDTYKPLLEKITAETRLLESADAEETSVTGKAMQEINQRQNALQAELITCKTMKLEIETLTDDIRGMQQSLLTRHLLARGPHLLQIIINNISEASDWLDSINNFIFSRLKLTSLHLDDWLIIAVMLVVGVIAGRVLRKRMLAFAEKLTTEELTTQIAQSLTCRFGRNAPFLLPTLTVLAALFFTMDIEPLPPSIAILIALAVYIVIASSVGAFLSPRLPARAFLSIDAGYSSYLDRRLQTLMVLGLVALLVTITNLRDALTGDQWRLTSTTLLLLTEINLVWLISVLSGVPGLLGKTMVRGLMVLILLASMMAEVMGYGNLSFYLFQGLTSTILLAMALWLVIAVLSDIFNGLHEGRHRWQRSIRKRLGLLQDEPVPGLVWLRLLIMLAIWTFFAISVVQLWGYNAASWSGVALLLTDGFDMGDFRIVPLKLAIAIIVFSLLITFVRWVKQEALPNWMSRTRMDRGAREAVVSISGYIGIIIAALFGLSLAGFDFTNIAIIAGALSVGIGFGLQNIVNNFISGIILLFERPIRTGDWIVVGTTEGYVRRISIRSTQIETFDRSDVIVPNSELISNQVTNWMLHDPWGRVIVPVGVAYGSDVEKVRDLLLAVAEEHPLVINDGVRVNPPKVLFRGFGDSSLNFELRCFIKNIDKRISTASDLNFAIDKAFREAGVEIPFPQRDLHIRSVDSSIAGFSPPTGNAGQPTPDE